MAPLLIPRLILWGAAVTSACLLVVANEMVLPSHGFNGTNTMTAIVSRVCHCRQQCLANGCLVYSITKRSQENFVCRLSMNHIPLKALETAPSHTSVHYLTVYEQYGGHNYKLYGNGTNELGRHSADKRCLAEGGQLAVAASNETMAEVLAVMEDGAVTAAWVGLYREDLAAGMEVPHWTFNNESTIENPDAVIQVTKNRCFNINTNRSPGDLLNNYIVCGTPMAYICQRD